LPTATSDDQWNQVLDTDLTGVFRGTWTWAIGLTSLDAFGPECPYGCPGAFEDFVSNGSLPTRSDGRFRTTVELLRAVDDGDQQAAEVWERSVRALAAGIASAINMLDPQRVILGGGIAQAGDRLFVPLQKWLDRFEWQALPNRRVEIAPAELGDSAGPLGAIRLAEDFAGEALPIR
jgi:glucokinase